MEVERNTSFRSTTGSKTSAISRQLFEGLVAGKNFQIDHVHLLAMIPPKVSISNFIGTLKGRTAIRIFNKFRKLKNRPYWGNHFGSRGYCVNTIGLDAEMTKKYLKFQEKEEEKQEKQGRLF